MNYSFSCISLKKWFVTFYCPLLPVRGITKLPVDLFPTVTDPTASAETRNNIPHELPYDEKGKDTLQGSLVKGRGLCMRHYV